MVKKTSERARTAFREINKEIQKRGSEEPIDDIKEYKIKEFLKRKLTIIEREYSNYPEIKNLNKELNKKTIELVRKILYRD